MTEAGNKKEADGVYLSVVVPVYNAANFIEANGRALLSYLKAQPYSVELIMADDGSEDQTLAILNRLAQEEPALKIVSNGRNHGKGYTVRHGFEKASGRYLIFNDSDLAYLPDQMTRILQALEKGSDVAIACRVLPESRYEISPAFFQYLYTRHLMGRFFNFLVRSTLLPGILDTQAGLKGFRAEATREIFKRQTLSGFSFDVEVLYLARKKGLRIEQVPVQFRYFYEESTVRFFRDTARMLRDLWSIRRNDSLGRYA